MMKIESNRLIIRNFLSSDLYDLYEIFNDEETMKNCEPIYDLEKTKNFLESFCIKKKGALAACLKDTNKVIGYILFNETEENVYEIGWIFNRSYWRKGLAYEACKTLIDYAFNNLNIHKVYAEAIDSVKSVGLMKKLGMKLEGIQIEQTKDLNGNWANLYFYGLLCKDWKILKK